MRRLRAWSSFALAALTLGGVACSAVGVRRLAPPEERPRPAGVVSIRWQLTLHEHGLFEPPSEECAAGALAEGRLIIGSRAGAVVAVDPALGVVNWTRPTGAGVDAPARYDAARGQVYVGADDGTLFALEPKTGAVRWTYRAKGAIEQAVELGADSVYVATAADRVIALDAASGKWRWQYDRDTPEGFTIHGYGAPRLRGEQLLAGFADGYLVALAKDAGELLWARSLAAASDQFVDVDATPTLAGDTIFAASYSGGLYALGTGDGAIRWRLPVEGAGTVQVVNRTLFFVTPQQGLHAVDLDGRILWRQGLAEAGDVTVPVAVGPYLVFSGSRAGLFVTDRATGKVLEIFDPGHGICAPLTLDPARPGRGYVLSNHGVLYALDLS